MPDEVLDPDDCVEWANAQIPILQKTVEGWEKGRGYQVIIEPDTDGVYRIFAYSLGPLAQTYNAAVGAVINSLRSSLDLLAAALARRNCVVPKTKTYFPIASNRRRL